MGPGTLACVSGGEGDPGDLTQREGSGLGTGLGLTCHLA